MLTSDASAPRLEGLARTILLLRDHVRREIPDEVLCDALSGVRVAVVGDTQNLQTPAGQHALVTSALLVARSGATVVLAVPDVPLCHPQPPLTGTHLGSALIEVLADILPGSVTPTHIPARGVDVALVVGDSPWREKAGRILRLSGDNWAGRISERGSGQRWALGLGPFGALGAAGLAAGEVFKVALGPLRRHSISAGGWDLSFAHTREAMVRLAPAGTPPPTGDLGVFDCVSGGAITQAALYALMRLPGVHGTTRVLEPEVSDGTNLNRYAFLLRSRCGRAKADDIGEWLNPWLEVRPMRVRYDEATAAGVAPLAPSVLVGVDDIPSRWRVQAARPSWLGVGATSHYSAMASVHRPGWACARCLHPRDEPGDGPIPTVAFVSHWAGLWLASYFVRARSGMLLPQAEQSIYMSPLRPEATAALWVGPVAPRPACPLNCAA
jgi:hypothetical protein